MDLMRLWSIRLDWLDPIGLVALWRESLLAKAVLEGKTIGYKNHPQLFRFKSYSRPLNATNTYMLYVKLEGDKRGFRFNSYKIDSDLVNKDIKIAVSQGQLDYELQLLKEKIAIRAKNKLQAVLTNDRGQPNNLFVPYNGPIEPWEKVRSLKKS